MFAAPAWFDRFPVHVEDADQPDGPGDLVGLVGQVGPQVGDAPQPQVGHPLADGGEVFLVNGDRGVFDQVPVAGLGLVPLGHVPVVDDDRPDVRVGQPVADRPLGVPVRPVGVEVPGLEPDVAVRLGQALAEQLPQAGPLVRVAQVEHRPADRVRRPPAGHHFRRRRRVADDAGPVDEGDDVGTLLDQGAETLFTASQRLLGRFLVGDVRNHAVKPPAARDRFGPDARPDPADAAVGSGDPILVDGRVLAGDQAADGGLGGSPIVPEAPFLGLAFNSCRSATRRIISRS